jgi:hypothetical protein
VKKRDLTPRAAMIKRQLDLLHRVASPPPLYIGPTRDKILGADPTKYTIAPIRLCQHGHPARWCVVCADRRGR